MLQYAHGKQVLNNHTIAEYQNDANLAGSVSLPGRTIPSVQSSLSGVTGGVMVVAHSSPRTGDRPLGVSDTLRRVLSLETSSRTARHIAIRAGAQ